MIKPVRSWKLLIPSRPAGMATPCLSQGVGKTCGEAAGGPRVRSSRSGRGYVVADGASHAPVPRISVGVSSRSLPIRGMGAGGGVASGAGDGGESAVKIDGPRLPMTLLAEAQVGFGWRSVLGWTGKGKGVGNRPPGMAGGAAKTGRKTTDFRYPSAKVGTMAFLALVRLGKVGSSMTTNPILGMLPSIRIQKGLNVGIAAGNHDQAHQRNAHKKNYSFPLDFPRSLPGH